MAYICIYAWHLAICVKEINNIKERAVIIELTAITCHEKVIKHAKSFDVQIYTGRDYNTLHCHGDCAVMVTQSASNKRRK